MKVLELAAKESKSGVEAALTRKLADKLLITLEAVQTSLNAPDRSSTVVNLARYDGLLAEDVR